ncbi:MAG: universal stress protein, partial [Candidatus Limnocylindrales bacterium]
VVRQLQGPTRFVEGAVLAGRAATVVVDEARTFEADLVIVGSRGHGTIGELVLGSVSSEIVDHARCPVLVARRPAVARILLASDGSPSARAAEEVVAGWSIFRDLPIRVVSVADVVRPWHSGIAPSMYGQVLDLYGKDLKAAGDEARRITVEAVGRLRQAGCDAEPDPRSGDAAAEIIAATDSWGADLVVLGSRGRSGLTRVLLGSVARNVAHGSTASVMVVHEPA